ncbi:MAG: hypothetical protein ABSG84_10360 [Acidobacteriaceae bacterium]
MRASWTLLGLLLILPKVAFGQAPWLTDDEARKAAEAAVHSVYPEPCYSTYRDERLESWVLSIRSDRLWGDRLNEAVYLYHVASDVCDYVGSDNGKPVVFSQVTSDCCEYGIVAVDRDTGKGYWFTGAVKKDVFREFARDEKLLPDSSRPTLFTALYEELVWGGLNEITSMEGLQDSVQSNFRSAYSPYERDNKWKPKFNSWWRRFQATVPKLRLETTYETGPRGTTVRGYTFKGFVLTTPRTDPPPKGTPQIVQWALLMRADGTVEELPSKTIYSAR